MAGNIILIGFMGVGKGRTARELAARTGMFAVDTDDLIESRLNLKIRKIFALHGESHFRDLEQDTANWLRKKVHDTIVSTGGGFVKVRKFGKRDTVVYLHAPVEAILAAIREHPKAKKKIRKRPLLKDLDKARALYEERLPLYRKAADLEIDVAEIDPAAAAELIIAKLGLSARGKEQGG